MRIYLLGFMGSGKSTLGQRIAGTFQVPFTDTDTIIESQSGLSITELFSAYGEEYFRHLEADVLRQTFYYTKSITSTGGGLPCYDDNMAWMKENGVTVYLQWPDEILQKHLLTIRQTRPLLSFLSDKEADFKIEHLLSQRKPFYEQSAITIEMSGHLESDYLLVERACRYIW